MFIRGGRNKTKPKQKKNEFTLTIQSAAYFKLFKYAVYIGKHRSLVSKGLSCFFIKVYEVLFICSNFSVII